jgi:hypothetical protein
MGRLSTAWKDPEFLKEKASQQHLASPVDTLSLAQQKLHSSQRQRDDMGKKEDIGKNTRTFPIIGRFRPHATRKTSRVFRSQPHIVFRCRAILVYNEHHEPTFSVFQTQRVLHWLLFLEEYSPFSYSINNGKKNLADAHSRLPFSERQPADQVSRVTFIYMILGFIQLYYVS